MHEITRFEFNDNELRTITDDAGMTWFVARDVCSILDLENVTNALARIPDNHKGVNSINTLGGVQQMSMVDEPGMYRLILRSDKPEAEPVMEWVTSEVLPAGQYSIKDSGIFYTTKEMEQQIQGARAELLLARPLWAKIKRYTALGLNRREIALLCCRSKRTIRGHIRRMESCGLLTPPKISNSFRPGQGNHFC